ncbi:MAG: aldehyde oxidoreductase [Rectinemataceae bacterium]|nr:aldehyde oxidoreductase [Rectinemataceae bacterium]
MIIDITVNNVLRQLQARSGDRLVDILRNELFLSSLQPDCLSGSCGRCFVFMDGRLVHSCLVPAFKAKGATIVTYESIADSPEAREILLAFEKAQSRPCAFCKKAKVMAVADLLARNPMPEREEILRQIGMVSCPCSDPLALVTAVGIAAEMRSKRKFNRADK